jgi:hypothetical protein
LREIRINADKKRKELKEDSLKYGKAVQSVYNLIESVIEPLESHCEKQENFVKEQQAKVREMRLQDCADFIQFIPVSIDVGTLDDKDYEMIANAARQKHELVLKAERLEREAAEAQEKARLEEVAKLGEENARLEAIRQEEAKKAREEQARLEAIRAEEARIAREEKENIEAALRKEQEEKAKKEAEEQAEKVRLQEEKEKAESAPDKEKLEAILKEIKSLGGNWNVTSPKAKSILESITVLLNKTSLYLEDKIAKF